MRRTVLLQGCPLSPAQLHGNQGFHNTLPRSQIFPEPYPRDSAERQEQAVGGALQRELRPDLCNLQRPQPLGSPVSSFAKLSIDFHLAFLTKLLFCVLRT